MITVNALSEVAALMGDPARASMLQLLMDGRAHTASDLALPPAAGVTAQTASGHLSRMVEANLLAARAQGRDRFYRLASGEVAHAGVESLMALAGERAQPAAKTAAWRRDPDLRFCRTCYDHLAGQVGIAVTDSLTRHGRRARGAEGLDAHVLGRAVLPAAGRRSRRGPRRRFTPLRAPVPGLERAAAAHLRRPGLGDRRHVLQKGWAERLRRGRTVRLTIQDAAPLAATSALRSSFALPKACPSPEGMCNLRSAQDLLLAHRQIDVGEQQRAGLAHHFAAALDPVADLAGATKSKVMLTVGRNLRRPTKVPPPIVPTRSATVIIMPPCRPPAGLHIGRLYAKAHDELVARALGAALGVEVADMAVEGRIGTAAVEIDAQETFGWIVVGQTPSSGS